MTRNDYQNGENMEKHGPAALTPEAVQSALLLFQQMHFRSPLFPDLGSIAGPKDDQRTGDVQHNDRFQGKDAFRPWLLRADALNSAVYHGQNTCGTHNASDDLPKQRMMKEAQVSTKYQEHRCNDRQYRPLRIVPGTRHHMVVIARRGRWGMGMRGGGS